jgi:hypothetical protein
MRFKGRMRTVRLGVISGVISLVLSTYGFGCADDPPPLPPPSEPAPPAEPTIPTLDALETPPRGKASVALPTWDLEHARFDHPIRQVAAKLGRSRMVSQVLLGEDAETGVMITFYGEGLVPGSYPILSADDETRAEHAGRDSDVSTVTVGMGTQGNLRSAEGLLTIESADDGSVTGRFEATVRSRNNLRETEVRARFHAIPEQWIEAQLEHQESIRDQLRSKNR